MNNIKDSFKPYKWLDIFKYTKLIIQLSDLKKMENFKYAARIILQSQSSFLFLNPDY